MNAKNPAITCPENVTKPAGRGKDFADVTWPSPILANSLEHDVICDHEEGSRFKIGTHRIKCSSLTSDGSEYDSDSVNCDFFVTVIGK